MPKCRNCVHWEVCREYVTGLAAARGVDLDATELEQIFDSDDCDHFQDRSRFVELPCKVGDTVFVVEKIAKEWKIIKDHVETIGIGYYADGVNIYQFDGIKIDGYFEDFGKTVFLTREAAEQALKERESNAGRNDT